MSFVFGGATGDDVRFTTGVSAGATGQHTLVCMWVYPTTLTAGRGLWSFGTVFGAEIGTTTSEVTLRTDNTTDSVWNTSGLGLVTNKWQFLAFLNSCNNTGPATSWRVWIGDNETSPVEVTATQATAPVGSFVGTTALCIGNKGTAGVVAFQGTIGSFTCMIQGTTGINYSIPLTTAGTIPQEAANQVLERLVRPLWQGRPDWKFWLLPTSSGSHEILHCPLDWYTTGIGTGWRRMIGSTAPRPADDITVGGGTASIEAPPRRPSDTWPNRTVVRRR